MKTAVFVACGVLAALLLLDCAQRAHAQNVCSQCTCVPAYDPVCTVNVVTQRYRGFSSPCVMQCHNKCRDNRFKFVSKGRCGKNKIQQKPTTTTPLPPPPTTVLSHEDR